VRIDATSANRAPLSGASRAADLNCRHAAYNRHLARLLVPYHPSSILTAARPPSKNYSPFTFFYGLAFDDMGASEAGPGVGFEFPSFEVAWKKRDLLLFAASIGATYPDELHFLYVGVCSV
jgi:hypothetical protein